MTHKHKLYLVVLLCVILTFLVAAIAIGALLRAPSPSQAFRRLVYNPIPGSVKDIRMDRRVSLRGTHRYVFHFRIDKLDLSPILSSRSFQEVPHVDFTGKGQLWWGDPNESQHGLGLYSPSCKGRAPEWFHLQQWDRPKVYVFYEKDVIRHRLLVYNENLAEAYFIDVRLPN